VAGARGRPPAGQVADPRVSGTAPESGRAANRCLRIAGCCLLAGLFSGAAAEPEPEPAALARANLDFAVHLFRQFGQGRKNLVFSPYSISNALAMASAGARGNTAAQLAAAAGITAPAQALAQAYRKLADRLAADNGEAATLTVANSLWVQRDFPVRTEFLELARGLYQASVEPVDFVQSPEAAGAAINHWVDQATAGRITDLIAAGSLRHTTRMVVCNAVYFKGRWQQPFDRDATKPGDFFAAPQDRFEVPTMHRTGEFALLQADGLQLAELPYGNGALSLIILLPDARDGLAELEARLSADQLRAWLTELDRRPAAKSSVFLPKFTQDSSLDLVGPLRDLGVREAFGLGADFSGIAENRSLYISTVLHKCYVKVDEEGTEATAATTVTLQAFAVEVHPRPIPEFRVDHPFLFLLRENAMGTILFLGRIADPR